MHKPRLSLESRMVSSCPLRPLLRPLAVAVLLALNPIASAQADNPVEPPSAPPSATAVTLPTVEVRAERKSDVPTETTGAYKAGKSASATKLKLTNRETPQSVSVITRSMMDDFNLNSANDALEGGIGVVVEKVETDRTYYTARGFDISNFQFDGIGMPFTYGNVSGDIDSVVFDRIDVVRGANGLSSSTGNPSATINFIRKRPTQALQASAKATLGSWDLHRLEADVAGALTDSGSVRGRLVVAEQNANSYLDRYSQDKVVGYGVVEIDVAEDTLLTLGHSHQTNHADSPMWGALPMQYTDGTQTDYDRSTSTATDWSYWDSKRDSTFVELSQQLAGDWEAKAVLTRNKQTSDAKLFYAYGLPERSTGTGLRSYPSLYWMDNTQTLLDVYASGAVSLGQRRHDLVVGMSWGRSKLSDASNYGAIGEELPSLDDWNGEFEEKPYASTSSGSSFVDKRISAYAGGRFQLSDALKLILGANATKAETDGLSYDVTRTRSNGDITPYIGAIYDLNKQLSVYASYADIFNPQYEVDTDGNRLAPAEGSNYELGLKGEFFDQRLDTSLAVFQTEQTNKAEYVRPDGARSVYRGADYDSQGIELEAAGKLTSHWQAAAGYTRLSIKGANGQDAVTYTPRQMLRLMTTYRLPFADSIKLGARVRWQDDIHRGAVQQKAYALLDLMARYDINKNLSASLILNNVTDEKYLTSLYWDQAYYGAPANGSISVKWTY